MVSTPSSSKVSAAALAERTTVSFKLVHADFTTKTDLSTGGEGVQIGQAWIALRYPEVGTSPAV